MKKRPPVPATPTKGPTPPWRPTPPPKFDRRGLHVGPAPTVRRPIGPRGGRR